MMCETENTIGGSESGFATAKRGGLPGLLSRSSGGQSSLKEAFSQSAGRDIFTFFLSHNSKGERSQEPVSTVLFSSGQLQLLQVDLFFSFTPGSVVSWLSPFPCVLSLAQKSEKHHTACL